MFFVVALATVNPYLYDCVFNFTHKIYNKNELENKRAAAGYYIIK